MRLIFALSIFVCNVSNAQFVTFWNENFSYGCNPGTFATDFFSFNNGDWTLTETGPNAETANTWYISATENGNASGQCGTACGSDATLHVGAYNSFVGTDLGASYFEGLEGFCDIVGCGATDKRIESGVVDCSVFINNVISFLYIEGGNAQDNATLWYYDGASWSLLSDLPKTPICVNGQGQWTSFSMPLPASSNNNPFVRIGFRWQNNDDGIASDPSFAVDDIAIAGDSGEDALAPTLTCPDDMTVYTEEYCYLVEDFESMTQVEDNIDFFPQIYQMPLVATYLPTGDATITIYATDFSGNTNSCSFTISIVDDDAPIIECPANISVELPPGSTTTDVLVPAPFVEDNCSSPTVTNSFSAGESASGAYPLGNNNVIFTATDNFGNTAQCNMFVSVTPAAVNCCTGDFNCDGAISVADLLLLISQFGCVASNCLTDLDDDSIVGVTDLQIFNGLYGTICPQ